MDIFHFIQDIPQLETIMSEETTGAVVIKRNRLNTLFGIFPTKTDTKKLNIPDQHAAVLTSNELVALRSLGSNNGIAKLENMRSAMQQTSDSISEIIATNDSYQDMLPEAGKAENILVTSILSPIDMYGHKLSVAVDPDIVTSESARADIQDLLTRYVNTNLSLGEKLKVWIGDALFRKGAVPVMVIPRHTITMLLDKIEDETAVTKGDRVQLNDLSVGVEALSTEHTSKLDITPSFAGISIGQEAIMDTLENELVATTKISKTVTPGATVEKVLSKLTASLDGQLSITLDASKIKSSTEAVKDATKKISDKLSSAAHGVILRKVGRDNTLVLAQPTSMEELDGEPIVTRLPTSSVFPVSVPGSPEDKLGYFVILDKYGYPLDGDSVGNTCADVSTSNFVEVYSSYGNTKVSNTKAERSAEKSAHIFDIVLNNVLGSATDEIGIDTFTIAEYNAMSRLVFSKIMRKEKVSMIFIPVNNLAYLAYQFREDGTGKTLMENVSTLVALRTSTLVAKVAATLTNATDISKIKYSMPNASISNVEQMNKAISKTFVRQYGLMPSADAMGMMMDIRNKSVRVVPTELQELKNFSFDTETSQRRMSKVDSELEDMFTKMIVQQFRVPLAAIDEAQERDFSRSVATSNILFSNEVRGMQTITCTEMVKLVRTAAGSSKDIVTKILEIVKGTEGKSDVANPYEIVQTILANVTIALPAPNISPDKARLSEISDQIQTIESIVDAMWRDELIVDEDNRELRGTMNALRALIKQQLIKDLVDASGSSSLTGIPTLQSMDTSGLVKTNQIVKNVHALLLKMKDAFDKPADDSGGGSNW